MHKQKMQTPDLTEQNIEQIAKIFPNVVTESRDENGHVKKAVDFDQLRQMLSKDLVEAEDERYRLDWPGKKASLLKANTPITQTLRPVKAESKDFETTENLYLEGDNFEILKILQESYLGKVKMIYIDPPYNTGQDFVYTDKFQQTREDYEEELGVEDEEGGKLFKNTDTNGRFHSDWLSMMYERLIIARDLLKEDGVIFMSIDDNEVHNLRKICDEIFGEENFVTNFVWMNEGNIDNQSRFKKNHEYILLYAKNEVNIEAPPVIDPNVPKNSKLYKENIENTIVKNGPGNPVSSIKLPVGFPTNFEEGVIEPKENSWPKLDRKVKVKNYKITNEVNVSSGWSSKEIFTDYLENDFKPVYDSKNQESTFYLSETGAIIVSKKRSDRQSHVLTILRNMGTVQGASRELEELGIDFSYPKPVKLIKYFAQISDEKDGIYLDFFSGSSPLAQSVLELNQNDNNNRRFICVQLPEKTDENSEAYKAGYTNISDIGKERIRRAGKKIKEELLEKYQSELDKLNKDQQLALDDTQQQQKKELEDKIAHIQNLDTGFRVYKTDTTNMKDVYYHPTEIKQDQLEMYQSNIKEDRTPEDLLTQVLLDLGLTLDLPMEEKEIKGNRVFIVQTNALVACFDDDINFEIVDEIAKIEPLKVVFKDASFKDDKDRINVSERFKRLSPETQITVI